MRKLLLSSVFAVFLLSLETGAVKAQTCTATPECAGLGYNKSKADCPKGALKCPTGDSYFCEEEINDVCDNVIQIGSILYSDFSICSNVMRNKTALGVVVYLDSTKKHGQAMSVWGLDEQGNISNSDFDALWATYYGITYDISSLQNYTTRESAITDFNSCSNTDKILADRQITYPTAQLVRNYAPTAETKGKWCLPAAGILASIFKNRTIVESVISKLGGVEYPSCCLWSSTEYSDYDVWVFNTSADAGVDYDAKNGYNNIRPVIEF